MLAKTFAMSACWPFQRILVEFKKRSLCIQHIGVRAQIHMRAHTHVQLSDPVLLLFLGGFSLYSTDMSLSSMFMEGLCECDLVLTVGQQSINQETAVPTDEDMEEVKWRKEPENAVLSEGPEQPL